MNALFLRWTVAMLTLMCAAEALADGKMFAEKVPTTIPYQRAIILHTGETQTLVLQSQYQIPGASETKALGWVVPVPAVPKIASTSSESADSAFMWMDMATKPSVTRISTIGILILLYLPIASSLIFFVCGIIKWRGTREKWFLRSGVSILVLLIVFLATALSVTAWKAGASGVETLESRQAGIYDVKVIRAKAAADLLAWLNENAFQFGPDDEAAIQAYLDKGWVFTVAKIRPSTPPPAPSRFSEGLADPLILRFPATNPIYPLALTAAGGHDTEVLIYLASDVPRIGDGRLPLRYTGSAKSHTKRAINTLYAAMVESTEFSETSDVWEDGYLSGKSPFTRIAKFKGTLTPDQMRKDLEFLPDPNQTDYREHIFRW
ncbi:MAG: DUF2330 domain-containing protein [Verrucomicrobia bacterium]|nr:DUF2330 domain-containing protein [Verrucomicrobiota bacterium]